MPLQVAFDISDLGANRRTPQHRRGVSRVVQEICGALVNLARDEQHGLDFTLTAVESSAAAADYLAAQQDGPFAAAAFASQGPHRRWTVLEEKARSFVTDSTNRALARRASRWLVSRSLPLQRRITRRLPAFDPEQFDIFHSSAVIPFPAYVRRARRPACLSTLYDLIPIHHPELVGACSVSDLEALLATFGPAHFGICISQYVKDDVCNYLRLDPSRVFVAPLAADAARFYPCHDAARIAAVRRACQLPDDGSPYLLSLCTVERRKNLLHLIRCFARLRREDPETRDLRLVLVGFVPEHTRQQVQSILAAEGVADRVILTGYVDDQSLAPLYSGALAFVFPSLAEGFGLPPLEAMQCGVPVISSDRTSLPEIVGDAGLLIDPEDADALCAAMRRVLRDEALRQDLSSRGEARAARFSWERCAQDHLHAYRAIAQRKDG